MPPSDRLPESLPVQHADHGNGEVLERLVYASLDLLPLGLRRYLKEYLDGQAWAADELGRQMREGKGLSDELKLHLRESPIPPPDTAAPLAKAINLVNRYLEIREWRESLRKIARREYLIRTSVTAVAKQHSSGALYLDYSSDRFGKALDEVDLRYIRECTICDRIYFAGRLFYQGKELEPYCSPKCGREVRGRRGPPRPPAKTAIVQEALKKLCKAKRWKEFERSTKNVELLADWADATVKECERVLEYLEPTDSLMSKEYKRNRKLSGPERSD
ncbi:MAG: hypothetical protein ACR2HX_22325 [Pyrinomonadaceae bacterium]